MPFVRDKNLVNVYEEIDKANNTIKTLSNALKDEEHNNSILKKHRIWLGVFSLVFLILFLWSFLPKSKQYKEEYLIENNLSLIDTDSLHKIQRKARQVMVADSMKVSLNEMPIVYSIQIGAYANFKSGLISKARRYACFAPSRLPVFKRAAPRCPKAVQSSGATRASCSAASA